MNGTNIPSMLDDICCMEVYIKIYPFIQNDSKVLHEMLGWFAVTYTEKKMSNGNFLYAWRLYQAFILDV